jgi:peptidoglycan/LPS O-acetylase OafA/YrhL
MRNPASISTQELLDSNSLARGLAMLAVVVCHLPFAHAFWKPLATFASAGKLAVSVFLFSSGLVLQWQANRAAAPVPLGIWAKKRFWRIYPVYWFGLALALLGAWAFRGKTYDAATLAANGLGIPLLLGRKVVSAGYTVPFWFISILLFCYLLFPAVRRVQRKSWLVLGAFGVSAVLLRTGAVMEAAALALPSFFLGQACADRWSRRAEQPCRVGFHAALFVPLLLGLAAVFKGPRFFHVDPRWAYWLDLAGCAGLTFASWPALVLVAGLQKALAAAAPRILAGLRWFAGLSFAVYVVHEPLLVVLERTSAAGRPWFGLAAYAAVVLAAARGVDALDRALRGRAA